MRTQREVLPPNLPPFGVSREQAAALVNISTTLFDKAVEAGTMPKPRILGGRRIYDVAELAEAFRKLPHTGSEDLPLDQIPAEGNPWD